VVIVQGFQGNFTKLWPRVDLICGSPDAPGRQKRRSDIKAQRGSTRFDD
jgi:hypothetical protein